MLKSPHTRIAVVGFIAIVSGILLSTFKNPNNDNTGWEPPEAAQNEVDSFLAVRAKEEKVALTSTQVNTVERTLESHTINELALKIEPQLPIEQQFESQPEQQLRKEIEDYLSLAEQALRRYRLTTPESDNAYNHYRAVLNLDAENERALAGLATIANQYANLAEREMGRLRYRKAKVFVYRGLNVQPDNPRLLALKQRVNTPGDVGRRISAKIKSWFR